MMTAPLPAPVEPHPILEERAHRAEGAEIFKGGSRSGTWSLCLIKLSCASALVDNAEGKRVAMATSSARVVEGEARELRKGRLPEEIFAEAEKP